MAIAIYCLPQSIIRLFNHANLSGLSAANFFDIALLGSGIIFGILSLIKFITGIKQAKIYIRNAPSDEHRAIRQMLAINIICMVVFLSIVIYVCTYGLNH